MKESWEAETSVEDGKAVDPLVISHKETSEGGTDSDVCLVRLE
jgi:hypothetical protein